MIRKLIVCSLLLSISFLSLTPPEAQMWEAINGERAKAGRPALAIEEGVVVLARERSNDMMTRDYFSHTTPEGKMVFDFLDERNIESQYAGEILGRTNQSLEILVQALMTSAPHRRVILNSHYTHLGIGCYVNRDGLEYVTVIFIGN